LLAPITDPAPPWTRYGPKPPAAGVMRQHPPGRTVSSPSTRVGPCAAPGGSWRRHPTSVDGANSGIVSHVSRREPGPVRRRPAADSRCRHAPH
jgi:hypothetical protein